MCSQRCSISLRFENCGGHFSAINSSDLRNRVDLSFETWCIELEAANRRWVDFGHKGMDMLNDNILVGYGV